MTSLYKYLKECEGVVSTPSNTLGIGNPGVDCNGNLTEPLLTAKCKKEKKKKPIKESILDNEEELIGKSIEYASNPLLQLADSDDWLNKDFASNIIKKYKLEKDIYRYFDLIPSVNKNSITFQHVFSELMLLCIMRVTDLPSYYKKASPKEAKLEIEFLNPRYDIDNDLGKKYHFPSIMKYNNWVDSFVKKYKLKSTDDKYIFYI